MVSRTGDILTVVDMSVTGILTRFGRMWYNGVVDFDDLLIVLNDADKYDNVFEAILAILSNWGSKF